ncbi:hypothetical protein [Flavobacterium sp. ZS1P14]|uniref:hypothetical protein n=1 Tax=Flavobacterium sp. ZS1P14 TaxID=3401729 RepID=UPI003AAFF727
MQGFSPPFDGDLEVRLGLFGYRHCVFRVEETFISEIKDAAVTKASGITIKFTFLKIKMS